MGQYNDTNYKSFVAAGTIAQFARVTLGSGNTITEAGITAKDIGTATRAAVSGDTIAVKLRQGCGTHKMIASAALAVGAAAFSAASGKIGASATTAFVLGTTMEASTADGDIIEVLYNAHGDTAV